MNMTKQQAICLKLAQWLVGPDGVQPVFDERIGVQLKSWVGSRRKFDPFAPTTEGRAQAYECVIKAAQEGLAPNFTEFRVDVGPIGRTKRLQHVNTPESITTASLEAIFYAVGGEWK